MSLAASTFFSKFQHSLWNSVSSWTWNGFFLFSHFILKWPLLFLTMCTIVKSCSTTTLQKKKELEIQNNLKYLNSHHLIFFFFSVNDTTVWLAIRSAGQPKHNFIFLCFVFVPTYFFLVFHHNGNSLKSKLNQCLLKQCRLNGINFSEYCGVVFVD